jgi:DNA-binding CsgD family transcriptional regulator
MRKKQSEPWLFVLFVSVAIVNLGYTLVAFSKTVEFALFANKITYLGQVLIPLCMFMLISKLCGYTYKKWVLGVLIGAAVIMFAIICTTGYLDWYYTSATIEKVDGATVLHKEYGVLHPINLIYVILYFIGMITVIGLSLGQHKSASQKHACGMLLIVLGNIAMWCFGKVIPWNVEFLSVTYFMSAGGVLIEWLMLQDYVHKKDIPKYTQAEKKELAIQITTMTMEEKISKVLFHLKNGENLTPREQEVLELILQHKKRREIGELLYVSESSVKLYTRTLYSKLGVSSREEFYALLTQKNET